MKSKFSKNFRAKFNPSNFMPQIAAGTKGPSYVSRALRPGGFQDGGYVPPGPGSFSGRNLLEEALGRGKGQGGLYDQSQALAGGQGVSGAGLQGALVNGGLQTSPPRKLSYPAPSMATGGNRGGSRGDGIAQRGFTRGRVPGSS